MSNKKTKLARARAAISGRPISAETRLMKRENRFNEWVQRAAILAGHYEAAWDRAVAEAQGDRAKAESLLDRVISKDDSRAARGATTKERRTLMDHLGQGTGRELCRLAAIMWLGREASWSRNTPLEATPEDFRAKFDDAERLLLADGSYRFARYLATKPLQVYVPVGLRLASRIGFDVQKGFVVSPSDRTSPPTINEWPSAPIDGRHFKVRPFRVSDGTSVMEGTIVGTSFAVSVDGRTFVVPTEEIGRDDYSTYAIVSESEQPIAENTFLSVSIEPDEDGMHGCEIRFRERHGNWNKPGGLVVYFGANGVKDGGTVAVDVSGP